MPQSDLSHYRAFSIRDCFVGLFECQDYCRALAHHTNILSLMCCVLCGGVFFLYFFFLFFCLPHRDIVKGMRSLREILRAMETKATQTFRMVRGMRDGKVGFLSSLDR